MQIEPLEVIRFLERKVKPFFSVKLPNRSKFSKNEIFRILSQMSIQNTFAEGTCNYRKLTDITLSADTLLRTIKNTDINNIKDGLSLFNKKTIKVAKRQGLFLTPVPIAIDWIDIMFYGDKSTPMVVGTQHKDGSNYAYRYITASILADGKRLVIAAQPFMEANKENIVKTIAAILNEIKHQIKISHVLFDRAFYVIDLISLLENMKIKFMIHAPANKLPKRALEEGLPFIIEYKSNAHKKYPEHQYNILGFEWADEKWFFATNMEFEKTNLLKVIEIFRKRWGVETSYRMINQFLPKTTSKHYHVRIFYFYFACIMYNAWALFNLIKNNVGTGFHIPVLFFKNLLFTSFLGSETIG